MKSYTYNLSTKDLVIEITKWNAVNIKFKFFNILFFRDHHEEDVVNFGENKSRCSSLIADRSKLNTHAIDVSHLRLFQFIDVNNKAYFEIISEKFEVKSFLT